MDNITNEKAIKNLVGMGFCQPKFYNKSSWYYANKVMLLCCGLGLAIPYDFGRGKGKYKFSDMYKPMITTIDDVANILISINNKNKIDELEKIIKGYIKSVNKKS